MPQNAKKCFGDFMVRSHKKTGNIDALCLLPVFLLKC